jgi:NAD-dependent DNA ligase
MEKLDGVSCLLSIIDDNIFLTTRGDGETGKDITFLKYYINIFKDKKMNLPKKNMYIRGELVIQKSDEL